jgi:hypothetical protein
MGIGLMEFFQEISELSLRNPAVIEKLCNTEIFFLHPVFSHNQFSVKKFESMLIFP